MKRFSAILIVLAITSLAVSQSPYVRDFLELRERGLDVANPPEGASVLWQSNGVGSGDDGDVLASVTAGGSTVDDVIVDKSRAISAERVYRGSGTTSARTTYTISASLGAGDAYLVEWYDTDNSALYTWDGSSWFLENAHGYAEIRAEGNSTATTFSSGSVDFSNKVKVAIFTTNFGSSSNATADQANDKITLSGSGIWKLTCNLSYTGTANDEISFAFFSGGGSSQVGARQTSTVSGTPNRTTVSLQALYAASSSVDMEVYCQNETATDSITIQDISFIAERISN